MADETIQPVALIAVEPAPIAAPPPASPAPDAGTAPAAPLAAVVEEFAVDAKAARRAEKAAQREKARLKREGPPRKPFVVTKCFTADGADVLPGRPILLSEEAAKTFADFVRPATDLDLSAGPDPRPIG